jgi:hypothetical protein
MTWAKATNRQTGEVHWDSTPEQLDPAVYTIELLDGEPVEPLREDKRAALDALLEYKDTGLCMTPVSPVPVSLEEKVKTKILGALSSCKLKEEVGQPFSVNFTLADDSRVTLDNTTVRQMAAAVAQYVEDIHDHAETIRQAIEDAVTIDDLNSIDVTAGWP